MMADRFPDGQLYVNLRGFDPAGPPVSPADAIRRFLDSLGVAPQRIPVSAEAQIAMYRSLLADKAMLVVLDNAYGAEQVRPLLPGSPTCLVVLTSRNRLTSLVATSGARTLVLDVLPVAEARQLLVARLGEPRVAAEPQAVEEIITRCAQLPLALAIAAARAATHPALSLSALAADLRDAHSELDAFDSEEDPLTDLRAVFSWSYQHLSTEGSRLFRLLGVHPGPDISASAAASVLGVPLQEVNLLLAELTGAHLVAETAPGRYTFHDLLRAYAADQALNHDSGAARDTAMHRMFDHYLQAAYTADRLLNPSRNPIAIGRPEPGTVIDDLADRRQATTWLTSEHPVLLATIRHALDGGFNNHTWQIAWSLTTFLNRQGHWHDWAATQHAALDAAKRLSDLGMQAIAHRGLGGAYASLDRHEEARSHLRDALHLHQLLGDDAGQAHTHHNLAWMLERQGRYAEALDHAVQSLHLFQTTGPLTWQAKALGSVGWIYAQLGQYQQALTYCEQALAQLQELGEHGGEAASWDTLGYAHHYLGHHDQAATSYLRAIELYRGQGNRHYEAKVLVHLGDTWHAARGYEAAGRAWKQALTILIELDHPEADQVRTKLASVALAGSHTG